MLLQLNVLKAVAFDRCLAGIVFSIGWRHGLVVLGCALSLLHIVFGLSTADRVELRAHSRVQNEFYLQNYGFCDVNYFYYLA